MANLWRDLTVGVRTIFRVPGYSLIIALTMALAIGANTLLFSIANPLILRPLPIKEQRTLGWIWETNATSGEDRGRVSIPDLLEWRAASKNFTALSAFQSRGGTLTGQGDAERVQLMCVTGNLADMWGLRPHAGRVLQAGDDEVGRPLTGVLSHRYWKGPKFNGDASVVGKTFFLDGAPITIVGVMQPEIEFGSIADADIWVPIVLDSSLARDKRTARVTGRLASGVTLAEADAEIRALSANQERDHQDTNRGWTAHVVGTKDAITSADTWVLLGLLGIVAGFVLLIASANLANMVLARVVGRRQDLAVRQALGASRMQLVRPLIIENMLLGAIGGVMGLGFASAGLRVINAVSFDNLLRTIGIDGNVLIFTAILSILTPVLFSLWPAMTAGRGGTAGALREARTSGARHARRGRSVLVVSQVALALALLVVSGLILRTMQAYEHIQIGLDVPKLMTFKLELPATQYADAAARARFADGIVRELGATPGAASIAVASHLPVFDGEVMNWLTGTRHDGARETDRAWASWFAVTPGFFETAGVRVVAGRALAASDIASTQPVAVLGRMAAEKYFDTVDQALGQTVTVRGSTGARVVTIVGVVADTRDSQITRSSPQMYVPFAQSPIERMTVLVRSDDPAARVNDARAIMRRFAPDVAITAPQTMRETVIRYTGDNKIVSGLFSGFAILALALAAAGLYGVISYSVGQRRREIGVRLALGAAPSGIRTMVLVESLKVTGIGMAIGLVLALLLGRAAASVLYGVSPHDPATFGTVIASVLFVSIVAVWAPATRAMKTDPVKTLRAD